MTESTNLTSCGNVVYRGEATTTGASKKKSNDNKYMDVVSRGKKKTHINRHGSFKILRVRYFE